MNDKTQQNGFQTFVIALAVSLLVFGTVYFVITEFSQNQDTNLEAADSSRNIALNNESDVQSVFSDLAKNSGAVLSDTIVNDGTADEGTIEDLDLYATENETAEGTPGGGSEMILGIIIALTLGTIAMYFAFSGNRLALSKFERQILEDSNNF